MPATVHGYGGNLRRRNRIAKLKAQGLPQSEIAKRLGIAAGTVDYYLRTEAPAKRVGGGNRPYHRRMAPIVLGSNVNGKGESTTGMVINDASLLDLLWARLTVEEKVKVMKGLED